MRCEPEFFAAQQVQFDRSPTAIGYLLTYLLPHLIIVEAGLLFRDRSATVLKDDVFARLLTFSYVLNTGHQAFFTYEALEEIAETTVSSILSMSKDEPLEFQVGENPALSQ